VDAVPPRGNQPDGTMRHTVVEFLPLYGYENDASCSGTIKITYDIPDGMQTSAHPHPGVPFRGIRRTAYLPNNAEGRSILALLRRAFDARLIFTVGKSATMNRDDTVTWSRAISHKTNLSGGPTG
jgi:deltex